MGAMKGWENGFAAVDWGSSARRAYVIDDAGRAVREYEDASGTLTIPGDCFAAEVDRLRAQIGPLPLLLAGMVGSNRGWMEAPYVPCPATLPDISRRLLWVEPGRSAIVPGVSLVEDGRADVMRGEEVQVFGAQALRAAQGVGLICHPGTHTKWIDMEGDAIMRFRTVMTGELFALIRTRSILSDILSGDVILNSAFYRGLERGFADGELGAELFGIRARVLLGMAEPIDAPSYASGLLIGCDLRSGLATAASGEDVLVVGRGTLVRLYAAAIERCGYRTATMDGGAAFVAGMHAISETLK